MPDHEGIEATALRGEGRLDRLVADLRGGCAELDSIIRFILESCPPPIDPLVSKIRAIGAGLLPKALGGVVLNLQWPRGVFATRLGCAWSAEWRSHRFPGPAEGVSLVALSPNEPDGAVRFEAATGKLRVEVDALPSDGRWRLYSLVQGDLFRASSEAREMFILSRESAPTEALAAPAALIRDDRIAEGWDAAIRFGWDDKALAGLMLLAFPSMGRLIADAAGRVELADPSHAFLLRELSQVPGRCLDGFQQSLIDRYQLF